MNATMARPVAPRNVQVPPAVRAAGRKRELMGWDLIVLPSQREGLVTLDPTAGRGTITINPATLTFVSKDNAAMGMLVHEKAEAVRKMQVTMVQVGGRSRVATPRPKPVLQQPTGIKALAADIAALVGEMAATEHPTQEQTQSFAVRYGKMRDAIKGLRDAFAEAEGAFETAQAMIIAQMMEDD